MNLTIELQLEGRFGEDFKAWVDGQMVGDHLESIFNPEMDVKEEFENKWLSMVTEATIKIFLEEKEIYVQTFRTKYGWESEIMQKDELISATKGAKGSTRVENVVWNLNNLVSMYNSNYFD